MTIRLRLAAAFTLLVATILILVGVATYQLLRQSLLAEIERDVAQRATALAASDGADLDTFGAPDVFLQVVGADGEVLARSANLGRRTLPLPDAARRGEVVEVRADDRPLFLAAAVRDDGRYVIVARSPITTYGALRRLRQLLTGVVAAAGLLTAVASWWYARTALSPIDRVVEAARQVRDSRDLTRRVPHRGPPDEVGRLVGTFNEMLAELADAYASLDGSHQRMRQFLADCSHELRTPLTRIRSTVDLLARIGDDEGEFRQRALADAASEIDRMARMAHQLLILARADAGATLQPRRVPLGEIVDGACRQAERASNKVTLLAPPPEVLAGVVVDGDADHLTQLVLILLDNAVKYTPPPGEVRLDAARDDDTARISVTDTGPGVAAEDRDRIFERFYRGRNAGMATGTGLGLAIARWIVDQHGGAIELDSSANGSRFTVRLPLSRHL
ncbi:MAG: sensor histidine kinase [Micromonosporaceae bacterium]